MVPFDIWKATQVERYTVREKEIRNEKIKKDIKSETKTTTTNFMPLTSFIVEMRM